LVGKSEDELQYCRMD